MASGTDEATLIARLRDRGDEQAFSSLYRRHTPALYGLALRQLGGDQAAAEDAVHDAWLRAVERLAQFRGDSAFRTWLQGFVVRVAWEAQRKRGARLDQDEPDDTALAADDPHLHFAGERVDLERALARLPEGFRTVLVLHDIEGFTHEEIGALLGVVPGTSKSQLARARQAMRRALNEGGTDDGR